MRKYLDEELEAGANTDEEKAEGDKSFSCSDRFDRDIIFPAQRFLDFTKCLDRRPTAHILSLSLSISNQFLALEWEADEGSARDTKRLPVHARTAVSKISVKTIEPI